MKVVTEQRPLFERGIISTPKSARLKYSTWAETNLQPLGKCELSSFLEHNFEEYLLSGKT